MHPFPPISDDVLTLLVEWRERTANRQRINFTAANLYKAWHYTIGIPVLILTTITGSSVFSAFEHTKTPHTAIAISILKIVVPVLVGLQTFLGLGEMAEKHRRTACNYGAVKRELEALIAEAAAPTTDPAKSVAEVRKKIDTVESDEPQVPYLIWHLTRLANRSKSDSYQAKKLRLS